jgi:hypothetical protein
MGFRHPVVLAACGALCASALSLGVPSATASPRASGPQWRIVARTPSWMTVAIAPTTTSAWAFGWGAHEPDGPIFPIGRHWNGHRWSSVQFPSGVRDSGMSCAGASSPTNVWAFSGAGASGGNPPSTVSGLRLRASGRWVIAKNFPISYVTGCNVLSPTDVWAFGGEVAGLGFGIGTWHFHGSTWTLMNTGKLVLFNASAVSAGDIWAVGADVTHLTPQPVMGRWDGHAWHEVRSIAAALPQQTQSTRVGLEAVNALSRHDVWVLASMARGCCITRFLVVHWNGHKWSRVRPGSPGYYLPTAVSDGHGGWWSTPYLTSLTVRYLLHRAHGRWSRFALPVPLSLFPGISPGGGIVHVPHSSAMLLAGSQIHARGVSGVILAFGKLPA